MDQGIIQNMKVHYRHSLLRERIKAIDSSQDFRFNLLNALHCLQKAWGEVKSSTVVNCFKRAGFRIDDDPPAEQEDAVMDELQLAWGRLVLHGDTDEDAKMEDYIHVDDAVLTGSFHLRDHWDFRIFSINLNSFRWLPNAERNCGGGHITQQRTR